MSKRPSELVAGRGSREDSVKAPKHYTAGEIETIDYIRDKLGPDGFWEYCVGNVLKYVSRHRYKGKPVEDLEKAKVYLEWAIAEAKAEQRELEQIRKFLHEKLDKGNVALTADGIKTGFVADEWYREEFGKEDTEEDPDV